MMTPPRSLPLRLLLVSILSAGARAEDAVAIEVLGAVPGPEGEKRVDHHNPGIGSAVQHIFLRAIRTTLRQASPAADPNSGRGGSLFSLRASRRCSRSRAVREYSAWVR